ncbi:MAG TPA: hypothetical protein VFS28_04810 [Gemmatimonadales bacterium]|nr:hypothetical protein [Gemmatimonadales bacterium]
MAPRIGLFAAVLAALVAPALRGQSPVTITAATRIHATPGGASLGLAAKGAAFTSRRSEGDEVEVLVEGWVWGRSVGSTQRDGFDLEVTQAGGQNLRADPAANGAIVAHLARGALLEKVEANPHGWVHVRRYAWVVRGAVRGAPAPVAQASKQPAESAVSATPPAPARQDTSPAPLSPAPIGAGNTDRAEVARATPLSTSPGGTASATLPAGTDVRVLTRAGEWTQVAVSGWVRSADLASAPDGAMTGVSAAQVRANPAQYVGKQLEWRLQVVSVMVADELRPEIPPGRTYLLTRGPLPESGFVYVVLPPDQVQRFRQLEPLKEVTVRVQVRAGSTKYLPNPVVDLVQVVEGA